MERFATDAAPLRMKTMLGRNPKVLLLFAPLLLAACSVAATPPAGGPTGTAVGTAPTATAPADEATSSDDTMPTESPADLPTQPSPPSPPKDFKAVAQDGSTACPSPNAETGDFCKEVDLSWTSTTPGTWFRIYSYWTGEGDVTCSDKDLVLQAQPILETDPDETSARLYDSLATGGGAQCLWITANSDAGESDPVAPAGQ